MATRKRSPETPTRASQKPHDYHLAQANPAYGAQFEATPADVVQQELDARQQRAEANAASEARAATRAKRATTTRAKKATTKVAKKATTKATKKAAKKTTTKQAPAPTLKSSPSDEA